jgi:hypothetical protein
VPVVQFTCDCNLLPDLGAKLKVTGTLKPHNLNFIILKTKLPKKLPLTMTWRRARNFIFIKALPYVKGLE